MDGEADRVGPGFVLHRGEDDQVRQPNQDRSGGASQEQRQCEDAQQAAQQLAVMPALRDAADQREVRLAQHLAELVEDVPLGHAGLFAAGELRADVDGLAHAHGRAPLRAEEIFVIQSHRDHVDGLVQLVAGDLRDAEDALLDRQHATLGPVRAFRIEAERRVVVQHVDDLIEDLVVLGHFLQAVALARDRQDARPAQELRDLGIGEDVGAGAEPDGTLRDQQDHHRVHPRGDVVGGEQDGALLGQVLQPLDRDRAEAGARDDIGVGVYAVVGIVVFPDLSHGWKLFYVCRAD